ncbi:hypothetical protein UO65_0189 [Actinokineospora spheciospongiae]|uniref:Uncharacterized protein n=1 Tax=Actinokineospora spheciospongiae TaxID=909613 RepID=W7J6H5_9PSEU|nr:hypothetical protein UO65_0189 [Actinokineospora spheciospongiae]
MAVPGWGEVRRVVALRAVMPAGTGSSDAVTPVVPGRGGGDQLGRGSGGRREAIRHVAECRS